MRDANGSLVRATSKEAMEQGSTSPVPVSKMNMSAGAREVYLNLYVKKIKESMEKIKV